MKDSDQLYGFIGVKALQKLHTCKFGKPCHPFYEVVPQWPFWTAMSSGPSAKQLPQKSGQLHLLHGFHAQDCGDQSTDAKMSDTTQRQH